MYLRPATIALVLFIVPFEVGCGRVQTNTAAGSQAQTLSNASKRETDDVEIESIQIFAPTANGDNKNYVQIKQLEVDGDNRSTVPDTFDVIAVVRNSGRASIQDSSLILLTTLDFIVAPNAPLTEADKIIKEYSWSRDGLVDDVKLRLVPFLETNKSTRIEFKGFDLSKTNKVLRDRDTTERVWAMKATVHVLNRNMTEVLRRDVVLAVAH